MMIKIVHFSDLHLGVENYGHINPVTGLHTRLEDFLRAFDAVVEYALDKDVDLILFTGDAYKSRDPNPTHQREFAKRIQRLSTAGIPVVLLVGNHDVPSTAGRANTVDIFATLEVEHVYVARTADTRRIETASGPIQIVTLPWIVRSHILTRDEHRNRTLQEVNLAIIERVENILNQQVEKLDPNIPAVLAAHVSVQGAVFGSEASVMLGQDVVLPPSMVNNPAFDYVALGHLHRHQVINEAQPLVVYAGSIERIDFGEEREQKGFVVVHLERGQAKYEFITTPTRPFVTIEAHARSEDPTTEVLEAIRAKPIENAIVRLIIHLSVEKEPSLRENDVRRALTPAHHIAAIIKDVRRPVRLRLGSGGTVEEMTTLELLRRYFEAKQVDPERCKELLSYAAEILADEDTT